MTQFLYKKFINIDKRAIKELNKLPLIVQHKFRSAFELLKKIGYLDEPIAKKLIGQNNLFEIRIKYQGQWRSIYSYIGDTHIIILSVLQKKTQKTPLNEIKKAQNRLKKYE